MTTPPVDRLDRIEAILEQTAQRLDRVAEQQAINTQTIGNLSNSLNDLSNQVNDFTGTANTVLGRSTMLDEIILSNDARASILENIVVRLDRNNEESNRKFEENQRSTNAALERLEAILIRLMNK
ncbi:hypothetical protein VB713_11890 [Anabaena cylindrica UHCC 0172]|uniref:hypothetical protein n=1 Tax=Anabaena cylindrica TaxID=1165 RepID=UPI002B21DD1B|nr:hypothetical protein [Anabaena cylindrica]MEA5551671.1 hypothetical protein [Anabaena cylindrica UHCC 0172]